LLFLSSLCVFSVFSVTLWLVFGPVHLDILANPAIPWATGDEISVGRSRRMAANSGAGIPLFDLQAQYRELQPELEAAAARVLASGQVILGPEVAALEAEVAAYCGVGHGVGCGSGTDALSLALHAL
jgi:hypothetical protein